MQITCSKTQHTIIVYRNISYDNIILNKLYTTTFTYSKYEASANNVLFVLIFIMIIFLFKM